MYQSRKYKNFTPWAGETRLHVAIECSKYFTEMKWKQNLEKIFPTVYEYCELAFFNNKF